MPNEIYYITFTIKLWQHIFNSDKYYKMIYDWFDFIKNKYDNRIYGYVIMPNHIHLLVYISDKSPVISKLIQNAKRFLAYSIVKELTIDRKLILLQKFKIDKKNAKHEIFEPRYDSMLIQTRKMFLQKLNYIHNNPCQEKWALSEIPEEFRHSSASNYVRGEGYYDITLVEF